MLRRSKRRRPSIWVTFPTGIRISPELISSVLYSNASQSDRSSGRTTHFTNRSQSDSKNLFHNNDQQADIEPILSVSGLLPPGLIRGIADRLPLSACRLILPALGMYTKTSVLSLYTILNTWLAEKSLGQLLESLYMKSRPSEMPENEVNVCKFLPRFVL